MSHPDERTDPHDLPRPKSYGQDPPTDENDPQQIERAKRRATDEAREKASAQFLATAPPKLKLKPPRFDRVIGRIIAGMPASLDTAAECLKAARVFRAALRRSGLKIVEDK